MKLLYIIGLGLIYLSAWLLDGDISQAFNKPISTVHQFLQQTTPLLFSVIVLIINSMVDKEKEKVELRKAIVNKINTEIDNFNLSIITISKICNLKHLDYQRVKADIETIYTNPYIYNIYTVWDSLSKKEMDPTNSKEFNEILSFSCSQIYTAHKKSNSFEDLIHCLFSLNKNIQHELTLPVDLESFLTTFVSSNVVLSNERSIMMTTFHMMSSMSYSHMNLIELNRMTELLRDNYSNKENFTHSLKRVISLIFFIYEQTIFEMYMYTSTITSITSDFNDYIEIQKKRYQELKEHITLTDIDISSELSHDFKREIINARLKNIVKH
ncbi:hypothetical protein [Plesiomonas shigelloides]|uniref:hypothetical protein n=1 Tax=Plesiomonas shigelloides TaxID=703 RepID=UPI0021196E5A|nr:hypothetical protein [Plesiomonas shigelloides]MCQ8860083.1 hypothetical protein [Plesiomonas shigelloides]